MATLSGKARRQALLLSAHYGSKRREQADRLLNAAVLEVCRIAENDRLRTKPFPAVYRDLAPLGYRWFKAHRYWFAIEETPSGKVIASILYDGADMPSRL